ncbi:invasion associated locus B family protein [Hymenobacter daeguensis]
MKRTSTFLLGWALLGCCLAAHGQTAPASPPQNPSVKAQPGPKVAAQKRSAFATPLIKDTAAFGRKFRRSGRPADAVPNRIRPMK